jgi:hypothetical protein
VDWREEQPDHASPKRASRVAELRGKPFREKESIGMNINSVCDTIEGGLIKDKCILSGLFKNEGSDLMNQADRESSLESQHPLYSR